MHALPTLPPLNQYQQDILACHPLADALAARVLDCLAVTGDHFEVADAIFVLYHHLLRTAHARKKDDKGPEDADEEHGRQLCATGDSNLLVGIALGRRSGPRGGTR